MGTWRCIASGACAAMMALAMGGCAGQSAPSPPSPTTAGPASSSAPPPSPSSPSPATSSAPPPGPSSSSPATSSPASPSATQPATQPATLPSALAGRVLTTLPSAPRVVALTFDGGASDTAVARILSTLADRDVTATFFVTGDFARRYPDRVGAMAAAGHRVGNHSDTHPDFTTLTRAQQVGQLARAEDAIAAEVGRGTAPWFRFPFGASSAQAITTVNAQGYACVGWTVDTLGWQGTSGGRSAGSVTDRVLSTARPGQIVLMHVGANPDDGSTLDADALPGIIDGLRDRGYGFASLDAALG